MEVCHDIILLFSGDLNIKKQYAESIPYSLSIQGPYTYLLEEHEHPERSVAVLTMYIQLMTLL
jgi:hypothetical protein